MGKYELMTEEISFSKIIDDCRITFDHYHTKDDYKIHFLCTDELSTPIKTDVTLLMRIQIIMLKNALEAFDYKEQVYLTISSKAKNVEFAVWNPTKIPTDIQPRIFRDFSLRNQEIITELVLIP